MANKRLNLTFEFDLKLFVLVCCITNSHCNTVSSHNRFDVSKSFSYVCALCTTWHVTWHC